MAGIKETKEIIGLGLTVGAAIGASLADDGKITFADIPKFGPAMLEIPGALEGIDQVPAEVSDLDEAELLEIRDYVIDKASNIPGIENKWLKVASGAFKIGLGIQEVLEAF